MATGGEVSSIYRGRPGRTASSRVSATTAATPISRGTPRSTAAYLVYVSAFPNWLPPDWYAFGGTSASTPQVAALVALANQKQAQGGHPPIGFLNPLLYQVGASAAGATAFRDILPAVQGTALSGRLVDNGMFQYNADGSVSAGPVAGLPVLTGWDLTTGWGSPIAPAFIDAITAARNATP